MPRPRKRKSPEPTLADPMSFVSMYCTRRSIPSEVGNSALERECLRRAQQAREEYKRCREVNEADHLDRKGLSPAEKYTIRLQNNRRSAEASKVFNEILKREQSAILASLPADYFANPSSLQNTQNAQKTISQLRHQLQQLTAEKDAALSSSAYEKSRADKLQNQLNNLRPKTSISPSFHRVRSSIPLPHHHPRSHPTSHHTLPVSTSHLPLPVSAAVSAPITSSIVHPRHAQPLVSAQLPPSQSQDPSQPMSQPNETNAEHVPHSSQLSFHQRLISSRGVMHQPWSLSSLGPEADGKEYHHPGLSMSQSQNAEGKEFHTGLTMSQSQNAEGKEFHTGLTMTQSQNAEPKEFHTGLTMTQSQPEDGEEKGPLIRPLSISAPMPIAFLGSQPSQSDMPPFKNEEMSMPTEPDFFPLGSQGSSKGRAP